MCKCGGVTEVFITEGLRLMVYIPVEGYPKWVKLEPVDPSTLTPTRTISTTDDIVTELDVIEAGEVVLVEAGTHVPRQKIRLHAKGTQGNPATVIFAEGSLIDGSSVGWSCLSIRASSFGRIIGAHVRGAVNFPIEMFESNDMVLQGCESEQSADNCGIYIPDGERIVVSNCYTHHNAKGGGVGVSVKGRDVVVSDIIIEGCRSEFNVASSSDGFRVENKLTSGVLIRDCDSRDNTDSGYDIKPDTEMVRCVGSGNGYDLKSWRGLSATDCQFDRVDLAGLDETPHGDREFVNCDIGYMRANVRTSFTAEQVPWLIFTGGVIGELKASSLQLPRVAFIDATEPPVEPPPIILPDGPTDEELGAAFRLLVGFYAAVMRGE